MKMGKKKIICVMLSKNSYCKKCIFYTLEDIYLLKYKDTDYNLYENLYINYLHGNIRCII